MSADHLADTPSPLPVECPECSPDLDPRIYQAYRCGHHEIPMPKGLDDERVNVSAYFSHNAEAGGADNIAWCRLIHGGKR